MKLIKIGLVAVLTVLTITGITFVVVSRLAAREAENNNQPKAQQMYKILSRIPYQRDVSLARLGDSLFAEQNFADAAQAYQSAQRYSTTKTRCPIYIKTGDSYFNLGLLGQEREDKQRFFQAAVDNYELCLRFEPDNQAAAEGKQKALDELKKLEEQQPESAQPQPAEPTEPQPATPEPTSDQDSSSATEPEVPRW